MSYLPYALAVWLFVIGLYGIVTSRHLVHLIVCLSVVQSSTYVLFLAVGYRNGALAPIFKSYPLGAPAVDPVVQALTLTDIVVSVTGTALLLALAVDLWKRTGSVDPDDFRRSKAEGAAR
jgi:multicomponent Na+:H+ antiporter subunit C